MNNPSFTYVDSPSALEAAVAKLRQSKAVALDTEFARFNTYYPKVGLVQLYDGNQCYLIDPLALPSLAGLVPLLQDPGVVKVLHACSEDMEVFQHCVGAIPAPVFDTQIAAAALGVGFSLGYQALVAHYMDVELPKEETRSDWLQRPLSEKQLKYACLDVTYLLQVHGQQLAALQAADRLGWVEAETAGLGRDIPTLTPPEHCYKKLKGLSQLTPVQLNTLRSLCDWRERLARQRDLPRNRVIDQRALFTMAKKELKSHQALREVAGMSQRQVRLHGDQLLALMAEARCLPEADYPQAPPAETPVNAKLLKQLKRVVEDRAQALGVAPEFLTKRRHLEALLRSAGSLGTAESASEYRLPPELTGWRQAAIGDALINALVAEESS